MMKRILATFALVALLPIASTAAVALDPAPSWEQWGPTLVQDFCERKPEHPQCATPTPTVAPTESPTAAPTPSPAPTAVPTATPAPSPSATPSAAPTPNPTATPVAMTQTIESQAWWKHVDEGGISVPDRVGQHIHVRAQFPTEGLVVTGVVNVPVTIIAHDLRGSLSWIRAQDEGDEFFRADIDLGPCSDCSTTITIPIDARELPTGRREIRISANNSDEDPDRAGDQRQFQSTGWQLCVRSCTESGISRSGPWTEARGWYTDHEYQNPMLASTIASVKAGATVSVRMRPGAGALPDHPTVFAGAFVDPDMHNGDPGIVIDPCPADSEPMGCSGPYSGTIRIPSGLAPGTHRLALLASDGQNAGVMQIFFVVP